jgi:hypothetical protein
MMATEEGLNSRSSIYAVSIFISLTESNNGGCACQAETCGVPLVLSRFAYGADNMCYRQKIRLAKIRSILDTNLGMAGACIPWQNKRGIEPLLINTRSEHIQLDEIPGIRLYRNDDRGDPFDIYFCKTKYNAYKILMGLEKDEVERRMAERSKKDLMALKSIKNSPLN